MIASPAGNVRPVPPMAMRASRFARILAVAAGIGAASLAQAQLVFNFTPAAGTDAQAIAGFQAAGQRWSNLFNDSVTVNINIGFSALGPGILGQAGSAQANYAYSSVRNRLSLDQTTLADATAVTNLQAGPLSLYINRTSNNPNGAGSATAYVDNDGDANNSVIRMSNANAKALGLLAGTAAGVDASITFSSAFTWDFDPTNGITAGTFDFIGVATHEIGHAMGFISGVDILDINSPPVNGPFADHQFTFVSTLDLFRYSTASVSNNSLDWTADNRAKYFSIDGGATAGPLFANGTNFGDGRQASHWKDSLGIGIMDPTSSQGELLAISAADTEALDVIGWNRATTVPDHGSSMVLVGLGCALLAGLRRRLRSYAN